jgi:uncharacterized membrane protein
MTSVLLWGVLLGGATYASLVYFPAYLSHLPESAVVVTGPYGLDEGVFWLTIHPLLILSLIISLTVNWRDKPRRRLIAIPFAIYIVILVVTQIYFLPELGAFHTSAESGLSTAEWAIRTGRWQTLNVIRAVVMYASMIFLMLALARPRDTNGDR